MNRTRVALLPALVVAVMFALLLGCSKQEPTAPKTETAAQTAPQSAPPAAQPAEPAPAAPATATKKPSALGKSTERAAAKPAAGSPSAPASTPQPEQPSQRVTAPPPPPPPPPPPAPVAITIPADTAIEVRMQETISSDKSNDGQKFSAILASPIVIDGQTLARRGANAWGTVVKATPSGRLQTPAELEVRLDAVEIRGRRVAISTATLGQKAASHDKRNAVGIGGGAALGAIIGGIAGGGKGAAIGAAAGAGAGTAGAAATGKKDISYPVESQLTFRLAKSVVVE